MEANQLLCNIKVYAFIQISGGPKVAHMCWHMQRILYRTGDKIYMISG
jgi:hypothetical protein